ncbi:MAG: hypothetical protein LBC74_05845 [Planctomycetaceae bacterium]|nr:hypothetical protein [Planctomycetaceae bacterium]
MLELVEVAVAAGVVVADFSGVAAFFAVGVDDVVAVAVDLFVSGICEGVVLVVTFPEAVMDWLLRRNVGNLASDFWEMLSFTFLSAIAVDLFAVDFGTTDDSETVFFEVCF